MGNNVISLPFDDLAEVDEKQVNVESVKTFMGDLYDWAESNGVNITTNEFKHQAAVIMAQLQVILMRDK